MFPENLPTFKRDPKGRKLFAISWGADASEEAIEARKDKKERKKEVKSMLNLN